MSNSYRDLVVWQAAVDLALEIYQATESFPKYELYGLASQMRRAAVSVPSNVAEGQARNSPREFRQFLANAKGSFVELETQLLIASRLGYVAPETHKSLASSCDRVSRLLNGLLRSLDTSPRSGFLGAVQRETRNQKRETQKGVLA